jgi:dTDP-4-dehydrorhamnose 3,5-epimerase
MKLSIHAPRDPQSVTPDWRLVTTREIDGVVAREAKYVLTTSGALVELLRAEWLGDSSTVGQVFLRTLDPGAVSAWHAHLTTTDRLFCMGGRALVVLYDAREASPTHGTVAEYRLGPQRPTLVIVPPGVFHGVKALGAEPAALINMPDEAYSYAEPDHLRLPPDAAEIPYRFS